MSDKKKWKRERKTGDKTRTDVISWGREKGFHDHEAVELHRDGDIDYYRATHRNRKKRK